MRKVAMSSSLPLHPQQSSTLALSVMAHSGKYTELKNDQKPVSTTILRALSVNTEIF